MSNNHKRNVSVPLTKSSIKWAGEVATEMGLPRSAVLSEAIELGLPIVLELYRLNRRVSQEPAD